MRRVTNQIRVRSEAFCLLSVVVVVVGRRSRSRILIVVILVVVLVTRSELIFHRAPRFWDSDSFFQLSSRFHTSNILNHSSHVTMDLRIIRSGKNKVQILHRGFRFQWNRGPQGPNKTTYFSCVERTCKATLATCGELEGELALKYHRYEQHIHRPDPSSNLVAETMSTYRQEIEKNPDASAKQLFEDLSTKVLETAKDTPSKLDIAKKLPTYRKGKE